MTFDDYRKGIVGQSREDNKREREEAEHRQEFEEEQREMNRKMVVKKNLSEYRTTKQLLALALSNRFTDKEYQTMRTRSEEFKSIKFRKRVR